MRPLARALAVAAALSIAVAPAAASASSWAGIRIGIGKLTLEVFYSVGLGYDEQSRAIRDPSETLFALAALIQANPDGFAAVDHSILFELNEAEDFLGKAKPTVVTREGMRQYFDFL
jgi:hypothetical protein